MQVYITLLNKRTYKKTKARWNLRIHRAICYLLSQLKLFNCFEMFFIVFDYLSVK